MGEPTPEGKARKIAIDAIYCDPKKRKISPLRPLGKARKIAINAIYCDPKKRKSVLFFLFGKVYVVVNVLNVVKVFQSVDESLEFGEIVPLQRNDVLR